MLTSDESECEDDEAEGEEEQNGDSGEGTEEDSDEEDDGNDSDIENVGNEMEGKRKKGFSERQVTVMTSQSDITYTNAVYLLLILCSQCDIITCVH